VLHKVRSQGDLRFLLNRANRQTDRQTHKQTEKMMMALLVFTPFYVVDNTPICAENAGLNEGPTKSMIAVAEDRATRCVFGRGGAIY